MSPCAGDGGKEKLGDGVTVGIGAGFDDLQPAPGRRLGKFREERRFERRFFGGEIPVFQEDELQAVHRLAIDAQVGVAPGVLAAAEAAVAVADVDAADEADPAVDHDNLAMGAEIDVVGPEPGQADRVEPGGRTAGLFQGPQETALDAVRPDGVQQQAHLHSGASLLDQQIAQSGSDPVRLPDVVFQVNVVGGCPDVGLDGLKTAIAGLQQADVAGRDGYALSGMFHQGGELLLEVRGGEAGRQRMVLTQVIVSGLDQAVAGATVAQSPPPQPPRPEQKVNDGADVGQKQQRQQPGQRRRGRAALQDQSHADHDQPQQPSQR